MIFSPLFCDCEGVIVSFLFLYSELFVYCTTCLLLFSLFKTELKTELWTFWETESFHFDTWPSYLWTDGIDCFYFMLLYFFSFFFSCMIADLTWQMNLIYLLFDKIWSGILTWSFNSDLNLSLRFTNMLKIEEFSGFQSLTNKHT